MHVIQIANAILNHKQVDIQNVEQSVDILKSGKLWQNTNSVPVWIKTPYPLFSPTEDDQLLKNHRFIYVSHKLKHPCE